MADGMTTRIVVATLVAEPGEDACGIVVEMGGEEFGFSGQTFDAVFWDAARWMIDTPDMLRALDDAQDKTEAWLMARGMK